MPASGVITMAELHIGNATLTLPSGQLGSLSGGRQGEGFMYRVLPGRSGAGLARPHHALMLRQLLNSHPHRLSLACSAPHHDAWQFACQCWAALGHGLWKIWSAPAGTSFNLKSLHAQAARRWSPHALVPVTVTVLQADGPLSPPPAGMNTSGGSEGQE